ncbi:ATP-binding Cassette (ABC) Superfamily, partial [Thraustotheca clavata]
MSGENYLSQGSEAFHANVASHLEAAMGKCMPKMEIRFTNLSTSADVVVATKDGLELPTLYNHAKKSLMSLFRTKRTIRKDILHPMSGVFKPSTLTLVLGQPASGKSSLMKVLSGRFQERKNITIDGSVTYNGISANEVKNLIPQYTSYVSQRDFHYPVMSVKETLEFAHACQQPKHILDALENGTGQEIARAKSFMESLHNVYPDIITRQMGLTQCQDTIVGNAMLRGVSGGERKRVTLGEMEFGMKMVSFLDEISTGLDSAATYDIVNAQKSMTRHLKKTIVIALLQPAPEVFELFDEVLLLNEGHVMYHGPRSQCLAYFESLGLKCPPKRDVADFLLDLGTQQQNQYISYTSNSVPSSPCEYAENFRQSAIYANSISGGVLASEADIAHMKMLPEFTPSFLPITWTLAKRQAKVLARNKAYIRTRFVMTLLMSFLYSSTFYQMDPALSMNIVGLIYLAMLFLALGQIPLVPVLISSREIFYKQRNANFFRTSSFIIAQSMTQVPYAVLETVVFGSILYWVCGFANDFAAYILYLVILILSNLSFVGWLFFVTMMSSNLHVAKPLAMVSVLMHITFAGFIITGDNLPGYFVWVFWIDPFAWTLRALSVNQYSVSEFQKCVYNGVDYCKQFGKTMGNTQLQLLGLPTETKWIGLAILYLISCYCLFLSLTYFALEYHKPDNHGNHTMVTVNDEDEETSDHYIKAPKTPSENSAAITIDRTVSRVPQVVLAFKDLWYSVPNQTKGEPDLQLLKGINGYALPGTITALMGSSGAGKTTLMDVIAGRKTGGKIEGQILLNG